MLVRAERGGQGRDVAVDVLDPDATIADLRTALFPGEVAGPLCIDGQTVAAAAPVDRAGITDGVVVTVPLDGSAATPPGPPSPTGFEVRVLAGLDAGHTVQLGAGRHVLGRADDHRNARVGAGSTVQISDPTVSGAHAILELEAADPRSNARVEEIVASVTDAGSTNGTVVGDATVRACERVALPAHLHLGRAEVEVTRTPPTGADGSPGAEAHQPVAPVPVGPRTTTIRAPTRPAPPTPPAPVGLLAVVASLAVGAALVVILHAWSAAAFALLGPTLLFANTADARRRVRRERRRQARAWVDDLSAFTEALAVARLAATRIAELRHPTVAHVVRDLARGAGPAHRDLAEAATSSGSGPLPRSVRLGTGVVPWDPPVDPATGRDPEVEAIVRGASTLGAAPIVLPLTAGSTIDLVGPVDVTRAVARSIVVQASMPGAAGDAFAVHIEAGRVDRQAWTWTAWLPHRSPSAPIDRLHLVIRDEPASRKVPRAHRPPAPEVIVRLLEVADPATSARHQIVLSPAGDLQGLPGDAGVGPRGTADGLSTATATSAARRLRRLAAADGGRDGGAMPDRVSLVSLLGTDRLTPEVVASRWRASGPDPAPAAVLAMTESGPLDVDLVRDGPHLLIAGTTGSGKSELLRTLIASLAVANSPRNLTFVLMDFKGGSAFDLCAGLPHTVGMVTDLDAQLAARALRCLTAELRRREEVLRRVGAADLAQARRGSDASAHLPRLVVVIDEFATLAADLPGFVDALVGLAQRGRSLGMHLVLATQRPSGAVSEHIRANIGLRIGLRLESDADSREVLEDPGASALPRDLPGRALLRFAGDRLVAAQTAMVGGRTPGAWPIAGHPTPLVVVAPMVLPGEDADPTTPTSVDPTAAGPGDLARIVDLIDTAWRGDGSPAPRPVWHAPLPDELAWPLAADALGSAPDDDPTDPAVNDPGGSPVIAFGIVDDPDRQRRLPARWDPGDGPMLLVGLPGRGTSTAAATIVLEVARRWSPGAWHVHIVDLGPGTLLPLAGLPHVGAVIAADDAERQRRLLAELADEVAARRRDPELVRTRPRRLVVIDGLTSFRRRWADALTEATWDHLLEVAAHGSAIGVHLVATSDTAAGISLSLLATCRQRMAFELGDRAELGLLGLPTVDLPPLPPGRALATIDGRIVQIARPRSGTASAVAHLASRAGAGPKPPGEVAASPVRPLGASIAWTSDMAAACRAEPDGGVQLVVGLGERTLTPTGFGLAPGAHAFVAGPPRSGRTTTLATLAAAGRAAGCQVVVIAAQPTAWGGTPEDPVPIDDPELSTLLEGSGPMLVLVDDADRLEGDSPLLADLARGSRPDRHLIVAGRADRLRALYAPWFRDVRVHRIGLLLAPDPDVDGELTGTRLPRQFPVGQRPGLGWLAGGGPEGLVQVARVEPLPS